MLRHTEAKIVDGNEAEQLELEAIPSPSPIDDPEIMLWSLVQNSRQDGGVTLSSTDWLRYARTLRKVLAERDLTGIAPDVGKAAQGVSLPDAWKLARQRPVASDNGRTVELRMAASRTEKITGQLDFSVSDLEPRVRLHWLTVPVPLKDIDYIVWRFVE